MNPPHQRQLLHEALSDAYREGELNERGSTSDKPDAYLATAAEQLQNALLGETIWRIANYQRFDGHAGRDGGQFAVAYVEAPSIEAARDRLAARLVSGFTKPVNEWLITEADRPLIIYEADS
jgi:hypothetical protein